MKLIGAHVSVAGGVHTAPGNAAAIGANAFALFFKNPRQWRCSPLPREEVSAFARAMESHHFTPHQVVPHSGYLINIGNADPHKRNGSLESLIGELQRCEQLGLTCCNMHPGAHPKDPDEKACLRRISAALDQALAETEHVTILLENTAGQGTSVGHRFEQLAEIISGTKKQDRLGICLDTCHAHAAGYDLLSDEGYDHTMAELDRTCGLSRLRALHLNDAKSPLGSHVDRHQSLGKGTMGMGPFARLMNDARLETIPMILETSDPSLWPQEIRRLRKLAR